MSFDQDRVKAETGSDIVGPVDALTVPRFAGVRTFARLPTTDSLNRAPDVAVLGAPFDGGTTFRAGSRFGPEGVRSASLLLRPYNEPLSFLPFENVQVADAGDAAPNPVDIIEAHEAIRSSAESLQSQGARVLGIGGDHSVSLPLLRAAAAQHGPLGLIQLDAHTDTWDSYFGAKVTHGTIFRRAAEEGIIEPSRSVQVGLRGSLYSSEDLTENANLGFSTLLAREFDEAGVGGAIELITSVASGPCYLTLDIDVLDPAFAPGTGTPEPGGLTTRELLAIIRGLRGINLVSADVVEVSPPYDAGQVTALAAANAAYDLLTLLAINHPGRM